MLRTAVLGLLGGLLWLNGCTAPSGGLTGQQTRSIAAPPEEVLRVAAGLLRRELGSARVDQDARSVLGIGPDYSTRTASGTARDLVGGRSTLRRVAQFNVGPRGMGSVARLRISIERQDTTRTMVAAAPMERISDTPAYTPIERDAATTDRQNTVWSSVRRDRELERRLLSELEEYFAPAERPEPPSAAETQPEAAKPAPS